MHKINKRLGCHNYDNKTDGMFTSYNVIRLPRANRELDRLPTR